MENLYPKFTWWQGVVENRLDPDKLGRYQVRIFGYHTRNKTELPTSELPWAIPMQPISSAAISGVGTSPTGLVEGSTVIGFFADGEDAQIPVIMGSWGCMSMLPEDQNGNPVNIDKETTGFYDPRSDEEANENYPHPPEVELGSFPRKKKSSSSSGLLDGVAGDVAGEITGGVTDALGGVGDLLGGEESDDTGYNRLKEPDSSRLARGGAVAETHASLALKRESRIKEGDDPSDDDSADGDFKGIPKAFAPKMTIYDLPETSITHPKLNGTPEPIYEETYWEEPHPQGVETSQSRYPFNHVRETESGHIFEVDDTPGAERIHTFHRSGTYDEIHADGTRAVKIVGKNYEIIMDDKNLYVRGDFNVNVEGDYNLKVGGNKYEDIVGHSFTSIRGNRVTKVQGNSTTEILSDESTSTGGNKYETTLCNNGTGQVIKKVGGKYNRLVEGRSKSTYHIGETITCLGRYEISVTPTFAMEVVGGAVVPVLEPADYKLSVMGDINFVTNSLAPNFGPPTAPSISMQSMYINMDASLGIIEAIGPGAQQRRPELLVPFNPVGKLTVVNIASTLGFGIEEDVLIGNVQRKVAVGNILDTALLGTATYSAVAGAASFIAGAAVNITSGAATVVTSGAAVSVTSAQAMTLTSGAATTVSSAGIFDVTGSVIDLNAGIINLN